MLDPAHPLAELLRRDKRYRLGAYVFVYDALQYAQQQLGLGAPAATSPAPAIPRKNDTSPANSCARRFANMPSNNTAAWPKTFWPIGACGRRATSAKSFSI